MEKHHFVLYTFFETFQVYIPCTMSKCVVLFSEANSITLLCISTLFMDNIENIVIKSIFICLNTMIRKSKLWILFPPLTLMSASGTFHMNEIM